MFDFGAGLGQIGGQVADFAVLGLGIDASGAAAGASRFGQATSSVKNNLRDLERAMGPVANGFRATLGALSALGVGMAGFRFGSFITQAVSLNARFHELDVSLGAVGRNAGYSRQYLEMLEKQLMRTGISAIQSRQQLLSMMQSQLDLTQATKLARVAQDVAVVGQLNSSDALARMTHGIVSAQTEVLRTIGLNVNFEQSYAKLAKEQGRTIASLSAQEKVQARVNAVMERASTLTGLYEASMTSAGKQLRSTERYVQDLQVQLGEAFSESFTRLVFGYADALKSAAGWAKDNADAIETFGTKLAATTEKVAAVGPILLDVLRLAADVVRVLVNTGEHFAKLATGDFKGAWDALGDAGTAIERIGANLMRSESQFDRVAAKWDAIDASTRNALWSQWAYSENARKFAVAAPGPTLRQVESAAGFSLFARPFGGRIDPTVGVAPRSPAPAAPPDERGMQKAADALAKVREGYRDLAASFRDQTALEALIERLDRMGKEAAQVKLPAAEVEQFRAAVLRAAGLQQFNTLVADARAKADDYKRALRSLAADAVAPLTAQLRAQREVEREILTTSEARRRAERDAFIRVDLAGEDPAAAARFAKQVADFEQKQAILTRLAAPVALGGAGMDLTRATAAATQMVENLRAKADAEERSLRTTADWVDQLKQASSIALGLAQVFRELPDGLRQGTQGAFNVLDGVQQLRAAGALKGADGQAVGISGALSGAAGAAGMIGALSGVGAVVAGVAVLGDALDLFGTRARERARMMADAAREFDEALSAFVKAGTQIGTVGAAIDSLRAQVAGSLPAAFTAAGARPAEGALMESYLRSSQLAAMRQRREALFANPEASVAWVKELSALNVLIPDLERAMAALRLRIGELATSVLKAVQEDYWQAVGDTLAAGIQAATDKYVARLTDVERLFLEGAISAEQLADAQAKIATTYNKSVEDLRKAEERAAAAAARERKGFETDVEARILAASGNGTAAEDARRHFQYEVQLQDAREKNYDVTRLLVAQELELVQVIEARRKAAADAATERNLSAYVRDVTLNFGSVAGALAQASADAATRLRNLQDSLRNDDSLTSEERARLVGDEVTRGEREQAALRQRFRDGFEQSRGALAAELTDNPVERARIEGTAQMAAAMKEMKELYTAGIITAEEMAGIEAMWEDKKARMVAIAQEQATIAAENFAVSLANATAALSGSAEDRRAAFVLARTTQVEQEIRAAQGLVEAGIISQEMFDEFARILRESVAPALLDAAFAAQEAARIMGENLNTLSQEWTVFGATAAQQLADLTSLYGFGGMSLAQVQALFTRPTFGQSLTADQEAMNERVTNWVRAYNAAQQAAQAAQQAAAPTAPSASAGAPSASRPAPQERITMLDADVTAVKSARSVTEVTATRLVDIGSAQLAVQRAILLKLSSHGETSAQGGTASVAPGAGALGVGGIDAALGTSAESNAVLLFGVIPS